MPSIRKHTARTLVAALFPLLLACGDNDNGTGPEVNALVGTWTVTSITIGGVEVAAGTDLSVSWTLASDLTYDLSVSGDAEGFFCESAGDCDETGTYLNTSDKFTVCDPGCGDPLDYTISGGTLAVMFTDDDSQPIVITFVKT